MSPKNITKHIEVLRPFLEGNGPNELGEWGMHCPLPTHGDGYDATRSASLNVNTGVWFCNACDIGGTTSDLVYRLQLDQASTNGHKVKNDYNEDQDEDKDEDAAGKQFPFTDGHAAGWHSNLMANPRALGELESRRSLDLSTLEKYEIGWDVQAKAYTIPVRDKEGRLVNVRRYQLDPAPGRRKIWGVTGHNTAALYPISSLDESGDIIICEGEWDALLTIQNGFTAITRTGGAKEWKFSWNHYFDDKNVYIIQDMDDDGAVGARKIFNALKGHAREVRIVDLPYPRKVDHGKDLTDFWRDGFGPLELQELIDGSEAAIRDPEIVESEFVDVNVLDSFDAEAAGRRLRMKVTITGKRNPPYLVPAEVEYSCSQDAGVKCTICPMNEMAGQAVRRVDTHDERILEMMGVAKPAVQEVLRGVVGAVKCGRLTIEPRTYHSVEELYVRPSVDVRGNLDSGDYTNRKIISVGRHDSLPNNTVEVVGTILPNPIRQNNEFQAWEVNRTETSIEKFEMTPEIYNQLKIFQPRGSQSPLAKAVMIAKDLASNVTQIYGRTEMHVMMDLVWHSILAFEFGGSIQTRGWLEGLVVGDTRTGKSEAATRLAEYYDCGEVVSCESATFAGIVGGLQQFGNKEWEVTWGVIPVNDRRLVVLDEVSGLIHDQIAQMSSIRSSGEAQLTKIRSERTYARTRLLWLGNPRNGRMSDYTFGVQAVRPLIGNNEDIARFDFAMSVATDEVDPEEINRAHSKSGQSRYDRAACRSLVLWAWSRIPDHVVWEDGAQEAVYRAALEVGSRYVEQPPLIQTANVRVKLARIAVAMAARTFSTDGSGNTISVGTRHVASAVQFLDRIYGSKNFGYLDMSQEALADADEAARNYEDARDYIRDFPGLAKFLRSMGKFRSNDLQDMLNVDRESANMIVNKLWNWRMISRTGPDIRINPTLHKILRELR